MSPTPLFDLAERQLADTSLAAYQRILPTLTEREIAVFEAVCDYLIQPYDDVTGAELAEWTGSLVTSIRPRLTGLVAKGWLLYAPTRPSRARYEGSCHPVRPAVPREAVERYARKRLTP